MIAVRRARPDDASGIAAVHVAAWRSAYAGILEDGYLAGLSEARLAGFYHRAILDRRGRIAIAQRLDQVAFDLRLVRRHRPCLLERRPRCRLIVGRHHGLALGGHVDVWPCRKRLAPETHRAVGVEFLRRTERPDRLRMIEPEGQHHSLVEVPLRAGILRVDRTM